MRKKISTKKDHKYCTRCQIEKLFSEFATNPKLRSGLDSWCRLCKKDYDNNRYTPKFHKFPDGQKQCRKCREIKPSTLEFFQKATRGRDGLHPRCKICTSDPILRSDEDLWGEN